MTGIAAHSAGDVGAVVEIRKVRQVVDTDPRNRIAAVRAAPNESEFFAIGQDLLVAVHADLRRGNRRVSRTLNARVAVAAVEPEIAGMEAWLNGTGCFGT